MKFIAFLGLMIACGFGAGAFAFALEFAGVGRTICYFGAGSTGAALLVAYLNTCVQS